MMPSGAVHPIIARRQRNSDFSEFRHLLERKSGKPDVQPTKQSSLSLNPLDCFASHAMTITEACST
jgi:hypothetical protein